MRSQRLLSTLLYFILAGSWPQTSNSTYLMSPSTGTDLPYSIQTKTILKHLFNNRTIVGGQVIALKDQPGKHYNGNYIDIGALGGVKKGNVFALFTPKGEPVGLIRVTETQHYTSTFEFVELTVEPTDNLIAKKVTHEIERRLPERLRIYPDMDKFKKSVQVASKKSRPTAPGGSPLPPLPGETQNSGGSGLPPLPGETSSGALPPLPEAGAASMEGTGLPPLPMDNMTPSTPAPMGGELPALPPGGMDSGTSLPPMDNSMPMPGADPSSGFPDLPPADNSGLPPMPSTGAPDSGLPALPPMDNSGGLPPPGMDSSLPPLPGASAPGLAPLPGGDMALPPIPEGEPSNSGLPSLPPQSGLSGPGVPMASADGLPDMNALPPSMDAGLPGMPDAGALPPTSSDPLASTAPPMEDSFSMPPPAMGSDLALPPMADSSLPPSFGEAPPLPAENGAMPPPMMGDPMAALPPDPSSVPAATDLPPMDTAALPPSMGDVPALPADTGAMPPPMMEDSLAALPSMSTQPTALTNPTGMPPALDAPAFDVPAIVNDGTGTSSGVASGLDIPAVPAEVKGGYLQDLPTLSSAS